MQGRQDDAVLDLSQVSGGENSSTDNEHEALIPEPPQRRSCGCSAIQCRHVKAIAHIFPLASALSESIETAIDLLGKPTALSIPVILVNGAATFGINQKFQNDSIEDASQIYEARGIPANSEDWPTLSTRKEVFAISMSSAMSLYTAFCDGAVTVHYSLKLPAIYNFTKSVNMRAWTGASLGFGIVRGAGVWLVEGMETWKTARGLLAGTRMEYKTTLSRIVSPTLGFTLAAFGSFDDAVLTWSGVTDVFQVTSFEGRVAFTVASSVNGVTDYCLNGVYDIEVLKEVLENTGQNYKDPKIVTAFILALFSGVLAGYVYQGLVVEAMEEWLEAFGIDYKAVTGPVVEVCADLGAAGMVLNAGGSIYPLFRKGVDWLCSGASYVYTKISYCCSSNDDDIEEFFADAQNEPPAEEIEPLLATLPIAIPVDDEHSDQDHGKAELDEVTEDDGVYFSCDEEDRDNKFIFQFDEALPKPKNITGQDDFIEQDSWNSGAEFVDVSLTSSGESIPQQVAARVPNQSFLFRLFTNPNIPADAAPDDDAKDELGYSSN